MLFSDHYTEPSGPAQASRRERGSKFLAYLFPVRNEAEIKEHLVQLKGKYPDATHHCYAWVLHPDKSAQRSTDDGEPSGSAGKPILRAILSADLTNLLVVVVRYFGGTQLGIPGLIQAYGESAKLVLADCPKQESTVHENFVVTCDFANENEIHRLLHDLNVKITNRSYDTGVAYSIAVPKSRVEHFLRVFGQNYLLSVKADTPD